MDITVDTKPLTRFLNDFEQRQVPFAAANSLNDTAKLFQSRQQQHMGNIFTVRRQEWVRNNVKIRPEDFATKRKLVATVRIESPGGGDRSDVIGKFETQTVKRPREGNTTAIPVEARRQRTGIIRRGERVGAIKPFVGATGRMLGKGKQRTFMLDMGGGQKGIFQRVGARSKKARGIHGPLMGGRDRNLKLLFLLRPSTPLVPNLKFVHNAHEAVRHFADFFGARFKEAMRTAR